MLLIYVHKITPRVRYTFKHVCTHILGVEVDFSSKIEAFIAHQGPKLSYGKQPLGKELYCQSASLLFESGFSPLSIEVKTWDDTFCFFTTNSLETALPFDIFAATFYLLTRYEEYFPQVKDEYGRFMATESLGYKHGFLEQPVIDLWALKFKQVLLSRFPDMDFRSRRYSVLPIISVSQAFAYKHKGVLRTIGGLLRDLSQLQFRKVSSRIKVISGLKQDPYDTFDFVLNFQKANRKKIMFLFGLGDYSNTEKSISSNKAKHRSLIKSVADYADVGLRISYDAVTNSEVLKKEKLRLEGITHRSLRYTQCSYFKINLPETYRNFVEMEIAADFSMGYPDHAGFRAGTCKPFFFYDLDYEVQTPLRVYSFCCTNATFRKISEAPVAIERVEKFMKIIKRVDGLFIPVFSNGLFVATRRGLFWRAVFEFIRSSNV